MYPPRMIAEYDRYDALGLAELVRKGDVTSAELIETCIARIEAMNPKLHCIVDTLYERARRAAEQPLKGPFMGVPFLIKDLLQTIEGVPTNAGSKFYKGWVPQRDGELYRRYRKSGLITVAKTHTPELGLLPMTEPAVWGIRTATPWDPTRTSGGSSGGAGASVASGIVPMAHGGDGGGSIRIPASCCGVFGMKPTRARTPTGPDSSESWNGFAIEHVLTRSVRDSAAALDATAGAEPFSPYHAPHQSRPFLDEVGADPGVLRIGFYTDPAMPSEVHPDCKAAVDDVAQLLGSLGHHVEPVRPAFESMELARAFFVVVAANTAAEIRDAEVKLGKKATPRDFETATWLSGQLGMLFTGGETIGAIRRLQAETRRLAHRLEDYDVILTPTLGQPPLEHGALKAKGFEGALQDLVARSNLRAPLKLPGLLEKTLERVYSFIPFTPVANFTGQPSMSVPLVWNDAGLPIGTMLTGRFGEEGRLFRLAAQLEEARPWKDRRPPIHAS